MKKFTINNTNWRVCLHGWTIPKYAAYGKIEGQEYVLTDFKLQDMTLALNINLFIADKWVSCRLYSNGKIRAQKESLQLHNGSLLYSIITEHINTDRLWNKKVIPCSHTVKQSHDAYRDSLSNGRYSSQTELNGAEYWSVFKEGKEKVNNNYRECTMILCASVN